MLSIASGPTTERTESAEPLTIDSESDLDILNLVSEELFPAAINESPKVTPVLADLTNKRQASSFNSQAVAADNYARLNMEDAIADMRMTSWITFMISCMKQKKRL